MRGKTGTPLTCRGAEDSTFGVVWGSGLDVGGADPPPGGVGGGRMKGESESPELFATAVGVTAAASEPGQGSVRKDPRESTRMPVRSRATSRKRYAVAGSRPESVVLSVRSPGTTVVGDQIP